MIRGRHTALRAIEEADLPQLLAWRNQPGLRRYFREYRELNSTQQRQWFDSRVNGDASTRMFAIVHTESDTLLGEKRQSRLIGATGLCYIDWVNRTADFSIYIGHEGRYIDDTLAPDAALMMIAYGFDELGLNRLWSEIYAFDTAKKRFFEQLGFSLDGRHRQTHWAEGAWHDSLYFSLLASDQRPAHPSAS